MSTQNNNYTVASLNVLTTTDGADSKASKPAGQQVDAQQRVNYTQEVVTINNL